MDGYRIGKLFFDACSDPEQRVGNDFRADPAAVVAQYGLSEEAGRAVLEHDLRTIYEAGVHPLLVRMGAMALYGGMSTPDYKEAIAGAVQADY